MATMTYTNELTVIECYACHCDFAIPTGLYKRRLKDHDTFWCPAGHSQHFTGKSEEAKLRAEVASLEGQLVVARTSRDTAWDSYERAERSARAYRGHLTRIKNRLSGGVCPVAGCRRSGFAHDRMLAHLREKHPAWCADHEDALR